LRFQEGDELIVSLIDHEANIAPWVDLAERQKLVLKWWKPDEDAPGARTNPKLLVSDLAALLTDKTRLVTCTHASNILGTIHDIKAIASTVHSHNPNTLVCIDGVSFAPHHRVDVKDLGVDFYALSWYKVRTPLPGFTRPPISSPEPIMQHIRTHEPRSTAHTSPSSTPAPSPSPP
jgi:selenocysteine lyase/cysteine desulfurase